MSVCGKGDPLSLSLIIVSAVLTPFLVPTMLGLLINSDMGVSAIKVVGRLIFVVTLPTILTVYLGRIDRKGIVRA